MSLVLRQQAQSVLDQHKMSNFWAGISDMKTLALCNDCGQEVIHIGGIRFSRISPTKSEIDYACELLGIFLKKNAPKMKALISAADTLASVPSPSRDFSWTENNFKYRLTTDVSLERMYSHEFGRYIRLEEGVNYVKLYIRATAEPKFEASLHIIPDEPRVSSFTIQAENGVNYDDIYSILDGDDHVNAVNRAFDQIDAVNNHLQAKSKVSELKEELNSCTVNL